MSMLILASASAARARLLREAGVKFGVRPPDVDEEGVVKSLMAKGTEVEAVADALAEMKAIRVSSSSPQALVLGCDQILVCEGRLIGKSRDSGEARTVLKSLRGKTHTLITACVLAQGGTVVWQNQDRATLWMRNFGDEFLETYLRAEGSNVLGSVGCYRLEGLGAQLFDRVKGDYFSILGLPLIPLLAALREHGAMPA